MKRVEIEQKLKGLRAKLVSFIERDPVKSSAIICAASYVGGMTFAFTLPIFLIAAISIAVLWFVSEDETKFKPAEKTDQEEKQADSKVEKKSSSKSKHVNGSGKKKGKGEEVEART